MQRFFEETFKFNGVLTRKTGGGLCKPIYWTDELFRGELPRSRLQPHFDGQRRDRGGGICPSYFRSAKRNENQRLVVADKAIQTMRKCPRGQLWLRKTIRKATSPDCKSTSDAIHRTNAVLMLKRGLNYQATAGDTGISFSVYRRDKDRRCILPCRCSFLQNSRRYDQNRRGIGAANSRKTVRQRLSDELR